MHFGGAAPGEEFLFWQIKNKKNIKLSGNLHKNGRFKPGRNWKKCVEKERL